MDIYTKLAKDTIELYISHQKLPSENDIPKELLNKRSGCFVSIHTKNDNALRGCIGTILPTCKNLGCEIINNAVSACEDSRFEKISESELKNIYVQVDVLREPEPIDSEKSLNVKKYGVIVKARDGRTGLLLPDIEGIDDISYQIAVARDKAGIKPDEDIYLYRFTTERHE